MCQLNGNRDGVIVTAHAKLGVRYLGEVYPFGTFKSEMHQDQQCPTGWIANLTNTSGLTSDGLCKKGTTYVLGPPPLIPNGTPFGNPNEALWGFFWSNTMILRGNAANGGLAIPLGLPKKTCGWQ